MKAGTKVRLAADYTTAAGHVVTAGTYRTTVFGSSYIHDGTTVPLMAFDPEWSGNGPARLEPIPDGYRGSAIAVPVALLEVVA